MQVLQILMETRQNSGTNPYDFYDITLLLFLLIERSTYICKTGRYVFSTDLNIYHTSTSALPQFNPLCPRRVFHSTPNSVSLSLALDSPKKNIVIVLLVILECTCSCICKPYILVLYIVPQSYTTFVHSPCYASIF